MPKRGYSYDLPMFRSNFEYFCNKCGQLRLCIDNISRVTCGSCGSKDIIKGEVGELDKEKLKKDFEEKKK